MSASETVAVAVFHYRHEGEIARGYLTDADIDSVLLVDDTGGITLGLAFSNPARLMVRTVELEEARAVLTDAGILPDASPGT
jgi:hypothetical protein